MGAGAESLALPRFTPPPLLHLGRKPAAAAHAVEPIVKQAPMLSTGAEKIANNPAAAAMLAPSPSPSPPAPSSTGGEKLALPRVEPPPLLHLGRKEPTIYDVPMQRPPRDPAAPSSSPSPLPPPSAPVVVDAAPIALPPSPSTVAYEPGYEDAYGGDAYALPQMPANSEAPRRASGGGMFASSSPPVVSGVPNRTLAYAAGGVLLVGALYFATRRKR